MVSAPSPEEADVNIEMERSFPASRETLWRVLHDTESMVNFIPGCERLEAIGPDRYAATLTVGVAALKGKYNGVVQIKEKDFPSSYTLEIEGRAAPGFVQGVAKLDLSETSDGQTLLSVKGQAQVGGLIATVGQRLLTGAARQLTRQMFDNIERELARGTRD